MKYKVILFDADETLFDFEQSEIAAFEKMMLDFGVNYEEDYHFKRYKEINSAIWQELERGLISQEELKVERFKRYIDAIKINAMPEDMADSYMKHLGDSSILLNGASDIIKELSEKYILSIVTNGLTNVQQRRIKKSDIAEYFKDIVISEEIGVSKPDPKIFEHALKNLGSFKKDEILMVGDNLNSDIKGGINFKIDTCWFNPKKQENKSDIKPTYEVKDYDKLREILL